MMGREETTGQHQRPCVYVVVTSTGAFSLSIILIL